MNLSTRLSIPFIATFALVSSFYNVSEADILTLHSDVRLGATAGKGMFGGQENNSFQEGHGTLSYGLVLGAELFFIDGWIQHDQFVQGGSVDGTWTQFMLGFDTEFEIGEAKGHSFDDKGNAVGGYSSWRLEVGLGIGFGVGTGQQVDPPLDNSEVTDKGFLLEGRGMAAYQLTRILSVGLTIPVQYGYFTKSGAGAVSNNVDNHYAAMSGAALLTFRVNLPIK